MRCAQCQNENPAHAKFCLECGSRLAVRCRTCATDLPPEAKFCLHCGQSVETPDAGTATASPRTYTPRHLAEKILTSRSAIEGERKQVTVLFCDVVESTRLAEHLDPETMHELMNKMLGLMAEAVHRFDGTVNQFLGDGLMALFGAPVALEDHALRAAQAALTILETIAGYSEQLRREREVEIRLRIGLNTGLVVVGRIGDDLRMDYTAVGDVTNLAARMQSLAEPGTILVTEGTHRLIEGYVRSEPLGRLSIKGRDEPVSAFRITGRLRARSRFDVSAQRGLTPLAGRSRELETLRIRLARAKNGLGQIVAIAGEAGAGKTRLLLEFRRSLGDDRVTWLEGHCVAYGPAVPYLPVLDLLRANFGIDEGDNPLQIEEKLRQDVRQLDSRLDWILPFLGELLSSRAEAVLKHLEPKEKRRKIFEAIRALSAAGAHRRPLILVLEDLHWIDQTSQDYLAFFVDSLAALPVLFLTTHRPGYIVPWADKTYYTQIALDLLDEHDVEIMMAHLVGTAELPAEFRRLVHEKAEGNPLFVEEITTSLQEHGVLARTDRGVAWTRNAPMEFPDTVQDIIRARLDRLEEPVKRTVQTAAVIGREFGLGLLSRVADAGTEVPSDLETLKHLELIHEKRLFPELEYVFKHAVTQDVAYHSLLLQRRKDLHTGIGAAIEELYVDRLEDQAGILAYHYARSHRPDRGVAYALLAGDRAARLFANAEATSYYEQGLRLARSLGASSEAAGFEIDAILKLAAVSVTRQDLERDRANLESARALARELDDEPRLAKVLYWLARIHYVVVEPETALACARDTLQIAERLGEPELAAATVNLLGRIHYQRSEFTEAARMLERGVEQMGRLANKHEESTAAGFTGLVLGLLGEFERAMAHADRGIRVAREIGNPFAEAANRNYRGTIYDQRGEWAQAIDEYERGARIAMEAGDLFRLYIIRWWSGRARAMAGDPKTGRSLLEQSLSLSAEIGTRFGLATQKVELAACIIALGAPAGAIDLCRDGLGLARASGEQWAEALAQRTLAEALAASSGDATEAMTAMREAVRLLESIGARPELARTYAADARLRRRLGDTADAEARFGQAATMFRELGMSSDLERLEAAP
ncbi:MAG: AAA family ATPase [Candidatus Rokubacteria bacterium]|nr:AAA family ATPase [Candidatus Rokubacteria bacterium]